MKGLVWEGALISHQFHCMFKKKEMRISVDRICLRHFEQSIMQCCAKVVSPLPILYILFGKWKTGIAIGNKKTWNYSI